MAAPRINEYRKYLQTQKWKQKSRLCIINAGHRCEVCFAGKYLSSHHVNYLNLFDERPKDLICLCRDCHKKYHSKYQDERLPQIEQPRKEWVRHITAVVKAVTNGK